MDPNWNCYISATANSPWMKLLPLERAGQFEIITARLPLNVHFSVIVTHCRQEIYYLETRSIFFKHLVVLLDVNLVLVESIMCCASYQTVLRIKSTAFIFIVALLALFETVKCYLLQLANLLSFEHTSACYLEFLLCLCYICLYHT